MFFDSLGRILCRAGEVARRDIRPALEDRYLVQQLDAIALVVSEVGAAWTQMFAALEEENRVLAETLAEAHAALGQSPEPLGHQADPLRRNRDLLAALDDAIWALHDKGEEEALRAARRGLRSAAEVEYALLSDAREASGMSTTRRL